MKPHKILIVDDEKNIRRTLSMVLRAEQYETDEAGSAEEALEKFRETICDLVILDIKLPGMDGISALKEFRRAVPGQAVIMISGHGNIGTAVEATREGALDFLEKPLTKERVIVAVRNALRFTVVDRELGELRARDSGKHVLLGHSAAMERVREMISQAAPTSSRILVLGESGTGKELVARAIHSESGRSSGPFVQVNCAAIPEELIESELFGAVKGAYTGADRSRDGKFSQADGGTLFLDEIGDMSLRAQAKVLRALQEGEIEKVGGSGTIAVDVRVIAATNKDLAKESSEGKFREDLFYRLNVFPILVPPLRERREDIAELANHYIERYRSENNLPPKAFTDVAIAALAKHSWPGNVRELVNIVERLAIISRRQEIDGDDVAAAGLGEPSARNGGYGSAGGEGTTTGSVRSVGGLVEARRRFEAACIEAALSEADGNVSEAARILSIDRTNLHKKIQSYGIEPAKE